MFSHTCALKVSHLCIGKSKLSRNFVSVGGREIFLVKEPLLQLKDLKNIHIIYNIHTLGSTQIFRDYKKENIRKCYFT